MASPVLPREVYHVMCEYLDRDTLLQLYSASSCCCWAAELSAAGLIVRDFRGLSLHSGELRPGASALSYLVKLERVLCNGAVVARGLRTTWPEATKAIGFSLDTSGPWFVEFKVVATKAPNGVPTLGVTDLVSEEGTTWSQDVSRSSAGGREGFALSFCPSTGRVFASLALDASQRLRGGDIIGAGEDAAKAGEHRRTFSGSLPWPEICDPCRRWNEPISAGIYVHDGQLTLYRVGGGEWHSSGVVMDNLPPRVSPCMFMSSFVGYAHVRFVNLWRSPPEVCPHCDATGHGLPSGWSAWPPPQ